MSAEIGIITNPYSKKNRGRTGREAELQRLVGDRGIVRETRSLEAVGDVVAEFLDRRVSYLVSDGGDGCFHWMLNHVHSRHPHDEVADGSVDHALRFIPANGGTIDFVAKRAGVHGQVEQIIAHLRRGREAPVVQVPTLRLSGCDTAGNPFVRLGFATAIGGVGRNFFDRYYEDERPGPKTILKVIGRAVAGMVRGLPFFDRSPVPGRSLGPYTESLFQTVAVRVTVDGKRLPGEEFNLLDVGASYTNLGGVIRLFPEARDGKLHLLAGNLTRGQVILNLPAVFLGRGFTVSDIYDGPARTIELEALEQPLTPVIDGELGTLSATTLTIEPGPTVPVPAIDAR